MLIIEQENFPRTVTELLIISQETPDFVTLLIYKKQVLEVFVTERFNTVAFFQSLTAAEMPSKLHIILIFLIFSITRAVIGSRIAGKCYALNQNQLRKSCSVCRKYFKQVNQPLQGYRIRAACLALSNNKCCRSFQLEENVGKRASLSVLDAQSDSAKYLRHLNHGIDLI